MTLVYQDMECQEALALRVIRVFRDPLEALAPKASQVPQACQVYQVAKDQRVIQDSQDFKVRQVVLAPRVWMEPQDPQGSLGPLADPENQAVVGPLDCPETKDKQAGMASLDQLD